MPGGGIWPTARATISGSTLASCSSSSRCLRPIRAYRSSPPTGSAAIRRERTRGDILECRLRSTVSFPPGSITADILAQRMMIHLCSAMYRKSMLDPLVERHPDVFVNPAHTCEDQQILLAMSEAGAIVMLPEVTLHYSVGHESVSHRRSFPVRLHSRRHPPDAHDAAAFRRR